MKMIRSLTNKYYIKKMLMVLIVVALSGVVSKGQVKSNRNFVFTHPGMLHNAEDLQRIKTNVNNGIEPWASAWIKLLDSQWLIKDYQPKPLEVVGRGVGSTGQSNISNDCAAAYYNAIAWYITGNEAYAKNAVNILNQWSYKVKQINGKDAVLCAGIYGYKFANAAEIMRYSYPQWAQKDIDQFKGMLTTKFYPVIKNFATFANGNWDDACLPTIMSIGIFCDDRTIFDRAVKYYLAGAGNGALKNYVIDESGQVQESGRDQPHTQGGIGHLANAAEIAYKQGIDLYSAYDNLLLKGFEYTAKYNLGNEVPFKPNNDKTGKYKHKVISDKGRGQWSPIYEMVYNHYLNRKGVAAPYTAQAATKLRPERNDVDHPGAGTLLFTVKPNSNNPLKSMVPASPAGVTAGFNKQGIQLFWAASTRAEHYQVKRSVVPGGPYTVVAAKVSSTTYTDANVVKGKMYYYIVMAVNNAGSSGNSLPTAICYGLPKPWLQKDIGVVSVAGNAFFYGSTYTLEAPATSDSTYHYVYIPVKGNVTITARFVPPVASQFAKMGLTMMGSLNNNDSNKVSLLIKPKSTADIELPNWSVSLNNGAAVKLDSPVVTWGRLMEPYWLRLSRNGNQFKAAVSTDGLNWLPAGEQTVVMQQAFYVGLSAYSGLDYTTTYVMFDRVTVAK